LILFPAIDVKDGRCVRLEQGDFRRETVFAEDPAVQAAQWEKAGASFIHVVDLDGARDGAGHKGAKHNGAQHNGAKRNKDIIARIVGGVSVPVQLGGGIRSLADVERMLASGVARVVLGTAAVKNPELVRDAIHLYGSEKIAVGIDSRDGRVAVEGWGEVSGIEAEDLGRRMGDLGVRTVIYTDIAKDGMMGGPNLEITRRMVLQGLDVVASGGVASLSDLRAVRDAGAAGAIIGRALYQKNIDLKEAIEIFERGGREC
jgi:phosphoribosylformimino-5-aminoimidazole carboxamide ribotide isomerase